VSIWQDTRSPAWNKPWLRLAAGILEQAIGDALGDDLARKWDALLWFTLSADPGFYLECLGYTHNTALEWLRNGMKPLGV